MMAHFVNDQLLHEIDRMMRIRLLLWLTGILLLLSVIVGSYRRRSKNIALKAYLWVSYTMSSQLVAYTLGLMQSFMSSIHGSFFPVWALLLMIAFGGADSFSGYSIDDNEQWRRYNGQLLMKFGTLIVFLYSHKNVTLKAFYGSKIVLLFLSAAIKACTKTQSLAAIKRFPLQERNSITKQHYPISEAGTGQMEQKESLEVMEKFTLADVWTCEDEFLTHGNDRLKDICMSFSFFKLLCLRYSGHAYRETHQKTWPWIRDSLLSGERRHERVFRVVEEELGFLYDILYTKYAVIFQPKRLYLRLVEFLLITIVSIWLISESIIRLKDKYFSPLEYYTFNDSLATPIALAIFLVSETYQVIQLAFTRWAKVICVCRYLKHRRSLKSCKLSEKCVEFICRLPSQKPWERKLHQYSLLESCTHRPWKLVSNPLLYQFVDWRWNGQKESAPVALSREVKEAVVDGLDKSAGSQLKNGQGSLERNNASNLLSYACEFTTQTEVIMVWHVATTICENNLGSLDSEGVKNFGVATSLSKYLAYLVAFEPRLLPDHPSITESLFMETIEQAGRQLRGCDTVQEKIERLYHTFNTDGDITLRRGTELSAKLLEQVSDRGLMWKILSDFWVELMLFVAPSDDVRAHAEKLANGGELLTHVWVLLYHAGKERRPLL